MIELSHICKTFRVRRRGEGMKNAVKSLFSRAYTEVEALHDVSFTIGAGEMVGYIGPNGAGKSSTIKIMSGILTPDSGDCRIDGLIPWKSRREHVKKIGVVFGQRSQLWWDVPVIAVQRFIVFHSDFRHLCPSLKPEVGAGPPLCGKLTILDYTMQTARLSTDNCEHLSYLTAIFTSLPST